MNKHDAAKKKAEWLALCLEIGWDKDTLDGLSDAWDSYYDDEGNRRPKTLSPSPDKEQDATSPSQPVSEGEKELTQSFSNEESNLKALQIAKDWVIKRRDICFEYRVIPPMTEGTFHELFEEVFLAGFSQSGNTEDQDFVWTDELVEYYAKYYRFSSSRINMDDFKKDPSKYTLIKKP